MLLCVWPALCHHKAGGQVVGAATVELSTDDGMTSLRLTSRISPPLKNKYSVQLKLGIKERSAPEG